MDIRKLWRGSSNLVHFQDLLIVIGDFNAVCNSKDRLNDALTIDFETIDFVEFLLVASHIEAKSTSLFYSI